MQKTRRFGLHVYEYTANHPFQRGNGAATTVGRATGGARGNGRYDDGRHDNGMMVDTTMAYTAMGSTTMGGTAMGDSPSPIRGSRKAADKQSVNRRQATGTGRLSRVFDADRAFDATGECHLGVLHHLPGWKFAISGFREKFDVNNAVYMPIWHQIAQLTARFLVSGPRDDVNSRKTTG